MASDLSLQFLLMSNDLLKTIAAKALPELRDMITQDVVLLGPSGPPIVGHDAAEKLCLDLFSRFNIATHIDFQREVIQNEAFMYVPRVKLTPVHLGEPALMCTCVAALRYENGAWKLARGLVIAVRTWPLENPEC